MNYLLLRRRHVEILFVDMHALLIIEIQTPPFARRNLVAHHPTRIDLLHSSPKGFYVLAA